MGADSKIEWTHHTFNPWWGCTRVSPGCEHCYAETFDKRVSGKDAAHWGVKAERRFFGEKHWREPLKWNALAEKAGERHRVFCASMADVFEDREELHQERLHLWSLIECTPNLDWLLLTKRPENFERFEPESWNKGWPANAWAGCTVEDQKRASERLPYLSRVPSVVRFVSAEPLLERVDLMLDQFGVNWVICGGESGHGARPMHAEWAQSLRDQCAEAGVAFHFKQWGQAAPPDQLPDETARMVDAHDPGYMNQEFVTLRKKHDAGRLLDGRTWDEFPTAGA